MRKNVTSNLFLFLDNRFFDSGKKILEYVFWKEKIQIANQFWF